MANLTLKIEKYDNGSEIHYDSNGNEIYHKYPNGFEEWNEYDKNNNCIHHKNSNGFEVWQEYDENNNLIHRKYSNEVEFFYINNKKVSKEKWEKYYKKHTLTIDGKEVQISNESFEAMKHLFSE